MNHEVHYVYVLRDDDRRVLYVGCTREIGRRLSRHRLRPWGHRIVHIEMTPHDDYIAATSAERALIVELDPEFNTADSPSAERADRGTRLEQVRAVFRQRPMTQHEARQILRLARSDKMHSWFGMSMNRLRETGELIEVGRAEVADRKQDPRIYALVAPKSEVA